MQKVDLSSQKLKETCCDHAKFSFEKDVTHRFSSPQSNYRCSFCKKGFKSAQALGGHMNIHRRDRAKMRLLSLLDGVNSNPNTNPNFSLTSSSSSAAKFLPHMTDQSSSFTDFSSPSSASTTTSEEKVALVSHSEPDHPVTLARRDEGKNLNKRALLEVRELPVLPKRSDSRVWKKKEIVRLELNMDLFRDAKDDLDLELRLGLS